MEPSQEKKRWHLIEEIFLAALELPATERAAHLEIACGGDQDLRRKVDRMLAADERTEGLLENPVGSLPSWNELQEAAAADEQVANAPTEVWTPYTSVVLGELLAERFRVVRFVAAGGMGEVFEAEDLELGEQVAIKTVRPELTQDDATMERFRREVQLARRVSHPAVCRCYDIFHHSFPPVENQPRRPSLTFLSMEFLNGETLAAHLHREGPMTTEEALPLVRQIAEGLAAAHDEGIVHRDLKSANVLLVPSPRGLRAVVTDFGLARLGSGGGTITKSGLTLGTPAYMAPEQVKGEDITPAADVYALGILMYEMVTGHFPFEADDSLAMALRRLHEDPTSPRSYVQDLEPRWERTILRCLKRESAERFATARDVIRFLESDAAAKPPPQRKWWGAFAATLGALALLAGGWFAVRQEKEPTTPRTESTPSVTTTAAAGTEVVPRRAVAVLGFQNLAGREEIGWLSTALAEMLTMELGAGERLRTIPGETVARMKVELELPDQASFALDTLESIQRHLGCDLVVVGSYLVTGEALRLDVRIEDVEAGTAEVLLTESGNEDQLLELVARTGRRLRAELGLEEPAASAGVDRALPQAPEAARLYAEGLASLRLFDALGARRKLEAAAEFEPSAPLVHAALAEAWTSLGHDAEAKAAASRAFELGDELPRAERMLVEARFQEAEGNREKAVRIYQALHEFFPDDIEHGLRLSAVQTTAGRGEEALDTLDEMRRLPSPAGDDPRLDLAEAEAAESLADYRRALRASQRGAQRSQALGARWLVADAFFRQGQAQWRLGEPVEAEKAAARSEAMFESLNDRAGIAESLNLRANIAENRGQPDVARRLYQRALDLHREIGHQAGVTRVLNNMAWVVYLEGDAQAAESLYEEALTIARELERKSDIARGLHNLALLRRNQGDLDAAKGLFEESLALAEEIGDRGIESNCLHHLARLLQMRGDPAALEVFERALALAREIGDKRGEASRLNSIGILLRQRGDLALALERLRESSEICRELGDEQRLGFRLINMASLQRKRGDLQAARETYEEVEELQSRLEDPGLRANWLNGFGLVNAAEGDLASAFRRVEEGIAIRQRLGAENRVLVAQTDLAKLHLAAGRLRQAETLARQSARGLDEMGQGREALRAQTVLARALLEQERFGEARGALESVEPLAGTNDLEIRLRFESVQAELDTHGGGAEAGLAWLEDLLRQAEATGLGELALEIRLALVFSARHAGRADEAKSRREALIADATTQGFLGLVARAREIEIG